MIPYILALFVVGIPLMILELGIGHRMRGSAPMSFAKISRGWEWSGWWAVTCAMFGIMLYYSVVIAWCLSYVFFSFNLAWGSDANNFFFHQYLQVTQGPAQLGDIRSSVIFSLGGVWLATWVIVYFGVQKGVERASKIFMPILFFLTAILVVWSVTLKGASIGIARYLTPDFSLLKKPQIWIDAFSQIFFTLSLAFGIMVTYASYLPRKANIVKDAVYISVGNCLFSIISGFAVFGTLGYMAYTTGQPIDKIVRESIGLAFVAYPEAISLLPAFANLFGVLFFVTLVIAGLSSAISLVEAFTAALIDKFHYKRKVVVSSICAFGFLGSIVFASKGGLYWVDIVDHFVTHYGLVVVGILECVLVGWIFKASKLREHINHAAGIKMGMAWDISVRFITPLVLTILLIHDLMGELAHSYGGYPRLANIMIGRDWLLVALIVALIVAGRPWRKDIHAEEIGTIQSEK